MVNLTAIRTALTSIGTIETDLPVAHIDKAIESIEMAIATMNDVTVKGKDNLDRLLGCIIGAELLIGGENNGR